MKVQALVVSSDPVYLNWLQNAVEGIDFSLLRPVDVDDLLGAVRSADPVGLVLFEFDAAEMETRIEWIERLAERMPDLAIAAVGSEPPPEVVLAAMRAGVRDFFVLRRDDAHLSAAIHRLLRRRAPTPAPAAAAVSQGKMYTLVSGHPHESLAFTAAHLALAFAESAEGRDRVLLIDAATPVGAAGIFLNLASAYSVLDAANDAFRCDQTLVDTAFARHSSGLYVLGYPEDLLGTPQLDAASFQQLVQVLRGLFSVVVVAIDGHAPQSLIGQLVSEADRAMWLTDQSILRARHSKHLLRALRLGGSESGLSLLVDAYQRRLGLEPEHLAELLDLPLMGTLGGDPVLRVQAMNAGEPMFRHAAKDAYSLSVRALCAALKAGEATLPAAGGGSLLQRWLG